MTDYLNLRTLMHVSKRCACNPGRPLVRCYEPTSHLRLNPSRHTWESASVEKADGVIFAAVGVLDLLVVYVVLPTWAAPFALAFWILRPPPGETVLRDDAEGNLVVA